MKRTHLLVLAALVCLSSLGLSTAPLPATGTTFTVTSAADNTAADGACTLREAILAVDGAPANGDCGADNGAPYGIHFNIGAGGRQTIAPASPLATIQRAVIISGTTQPGCSAYPCIELDGAGAGLANGLVITGGASTVEGLVINRFSQAGIELLTNGGDSLLDDYLGVDITGTQALGNGTNGLYLCCGANNNLIGGVANSASNVISGNGNYGVLISQGSSGNWVQHNYIGTTLGASLHLGNHFDGLAVAAFGAPAPNNNIIGQKLDGSGRGNFIAYNNGNGVTIGASHVDATAGNAILGNNIFANGCLGIDLSDAATGCSGGVSVTPNHANCTGVGPNRYQNYPLLAGADYGGGLTSVRGSLNCKPNTSYRVEFFVSGVADGSGHGEGSLYLSGTSVTTDGAGNAPFSATFASINTLGLQLSATATDPNGSTSEFAADLPVAALFAAWLPMVAR